jgi:hypothetical protein
VRKIVILIFILVIPAVCSAQTTKGSWENLSGLHSGQKVQIIGTDSKKHSGTFTSFSDTAISFHEATGDQMIQKLNISGVKLMENHHRLRNTLIGAGIGAGAGAGIGAAGGSCTVSQLGCFPHSRAIGAGIFGIIGLLGGAVVGALIPSHVTIYNTNAH